MRLFIVVAGFIAVFGGTALADDQNNPLAAAGDWAAMSHSDSETDPPNLCVAADMNAGFGIRIDNTGDIEFRLVNEAWALPANVTGKLTFAVNGNTYLFDISGNTVNSVAADITQQQLLPVVADMEKAASMSIKAGSSAAQNVSLSGSSVVLTALLTCADIQAPSSKTGGENPFQGSSPSSNQ